jgi:tetratricopeptide (TPR) repeat protein
MAIAAEVIAQGRQRATTEISLRLARDAAAAKIYRDQNDILAYAHTIRHTADIYRQESKLVEAKPLYEECLEIYRSNLSTKILDLANVLRPYALLNEVQGSLELARELWEKARQLYNSVRVAPGVSECDEHISKLQQT